MLNFRDFFLCIDKTNPSFYENVNYRDIHKQKIIYIFEVVIYTGDTNNIHVNSFLLILVGCL